MMFSCGYQLAKGRVCAIKLYLQALASYQGLQHGGKAGVRGYYATRDRLSSPHLKRFVTGILVWEKMVLGPKFPTEIMVHQTIFPRNII